MEFPRRKNSVFGQLSVNYPLPNPLQNANFINIVVSAIRANLRIDSRESGHSRVSRGSCAQAQPELPTSIVEALIASLVLLAIQSAETRVRTMRPEAEPHK